MAAVTRPNANESKQTPVSPKLKSRENKGILCRNVTIYGKCRYEDKGCAFSHDSDRLISSATPNGAASLESLNAKKSLNVDSPSFTPSFLSPNGATTTSKKPVAISPKAASAAPFTPKNILSRPANPTPPVPVRNDASTPDWAMVEIKEFVPRSLNESLQGSESSSHGFENFQPTPTHIPYIEQNINGGTYYPSSQGFQQPVQYHQYAPIGAYPNSLLPYQRTVHDLFIPNELREEIHKKSAATLQTLANSMLPSHIENYHSLVPLDTNSQKGSTIFGGYHSWVYKAQSSTTGHYLALRRVGNFRLTNELAIRTVQSWKQVSSASVVKIVDAFTNRAFGDSSLFVVTEYHPMSKTLIEHHHIGQGRHVRGRTSLDHVSETILWSYVVQLASALKTIHANGLAARLIDPSKVIVTGKGRIRLNGCAVLDVIQYDAQVSMQQLQRQDLVNFGLTILAVGANVLDVSQSFPRAMDQLKKFYKPDLQNTVVWLYSALQNPEKTIDQFIGTVSAQMITAFNGALHADDSLYTDLSREVENARLFRLLAKLNFINERPEFEHDQRWSENGERYFLKLFRDHIFHQVDGQNRPVIDLAHVLTSLNKLDAGTDERVTLISRDEQSCFVVSYRELKKGIESAFQDLMKGSRRIH